MKKWMTLMMMVILLAGCQKTVNDQGQQQYKLDPNSTAKFEAATEGAISAGAALSVFFPWLLPFVTAAGGAFAAWKKVKPQLETAQSKEAMYYNTTDSIVQGIENFKATNPAEWEKLKAFLRVTPEIENVIKAIRGLPHIEG